MNRVILTAFPLLLAVGCASLQDHQYRATNYLRAGVAWRQCHGQLGDRLISSHFETGWKRGYYDVATGSDGTPPPVPPEKYWKSKYQNAAGEQAVSDWYCGYREGAAAAIAENRGVLHDLPHLDVGIDPRCNENPSILPTYSGHLEPFAICGNGTPCNSSCVAEAVALPDTFHIPEVAPGPEVSSELPAPVDSHEKPKAPEGGDQHDDVTQRRQRLEGAPHLDMQLAHIEFHPWSVGMTGEDQPGGENQSSQWTTPEDLQESSVTEQRRASDQAMAAPPNAAIAQTDPPATEADKRPQDKRPQDKRPQDLVILDDVVALTPEPEVTPVLNENTMHIRTQDSTKPDLQLERDANEARERNTTRIVRLLPKPPAKPVPLRPDVRIEMTVRHAIASDSASDPLITLVSDNEMLLISDTYVTDDEPLISK